MIAGLPMTTVGSESGLLPSNVGQPMYFDSGLFSGRHIRVELKELQQAQLGRKYSKFMIPYANYYQPTASRYAKVDRRPLDPPPTILLRIFTVYDFGTHRQREEEVENYQ
jgi:hypothetical protein